MIGHASKDERGKASGGKAGDQTGAEVCVRSWYSAGWNKVLRAKSADVRETMAKACETLCKGNFVGYDQWQRNTLWDELAKIGWKPERLKTKCETDCSALMTACAKVAGIEVARTHLGGGVYNAPVTQTMCAAFKATGAFDILTEQKYLTSDKYLLRGDILVRESGHTAMNLTNGSLSKAGAGTSGASEKKPVEEIAREVLDGKWGVGEARKTALTAAGYDYTAVQAAVNTLLSAPKGESEQTSIESVKEDEKMDDVTKLTDAECYEIIVKAQRYAAALPASSWAVEKLAKAKEDGITDGDRPLALVTREEAAIMADRARGGQTV